jgi:hypothetical protein
VLALLLLQAGALGSASMSRAGGAVKIVYRASDIDSLDPALSYSVSAAELLDPTCALLL